MAKNRQYINWQMVLASTLVVGVTLTYSATHTCAQNITLDSTLGSGTAETLTGPNYQIPESLGKTVGNNLFHSFGKFNLNANEAAIFESSNNIRNILSRVTGGTPSSIDGLIRTLGSNVNFFLINPSGIIFGQNARLDVSGSFVASTANGIEFGNQGFFSATNPEPPSSLLTINPSVLFFNQLQAGRIETSSSLRVPSGRSLLLVGGDITLNGSRLNAPGGRVELSGVKNSGIVGLSLDQNNLSLSFPDDVVLADVLLTNQAQVNVSADGGGSIAVHAQSLEINQGSLLLAGISFGRGETGAQAGDIELNTTGNITLDRGFIFNDLQENAVGKGGNIKVTTNKLSVINSSVMAASTFGLGDAGSLFINAKEAISFDAPSSAFSTVELNGQGNSGNIYIDTGSLSVTNGAELSVSTFNKGDAGNLIINANTVSLDGEDSNGFRSGIFSQLRDNAIGKGGSIEINTDSLSVTNGALVVANTRGQGNAGSIKINARDTVSVDGTSSRGLSSAVTSRVVETGVGHGGSIEISTGSLFVTNGAQLQATTNGNGNAGTIKIDARDTVSFDGTSSRGFSSGAFSSVQQNAIGQGGSIEIITGSVSITNGGILIASTNGQGNAGNVIIDARNTVNFDRGQVVSSVLNNGIGKGGRINITSNNLAVNNGSDLTVSTSGQGDAGDVIINANDTISFDRSRVDSVVEEKAEGQGGNIAITTNKLAVTNGALLNASTIGKGDAGSVIINAHERATFDGQDSDGSASGAASIVAAKAQGNGGKIDITTGSLYVTNGAQLAANTLGKGNAGSIIVNSRDRAIFAGDQSVAFSNVNQTAEGNGGDIKISTDFLSVTDSAQLIAFTEGKGNAGNVIINANNVLFDGVSRLFPTFRSAAFSQVRENAIGKGGNIEITTGSLSVTNGAQLQASTDGQGDAGNVIINARDTVLFDGVSSNGQSVSRAFSQVRPKANGRGGSIDITAGSFVVTNNAQLSASTLGEGEAGNIKVTADTFAATNGGKLLTATSSRFPAGNITVKVRDDITLAGADTGLFANTTAGSTGKGGSIFIDPETFTIRDGARVAVDSQGEGVGGNIELAAGFLTLDNGTISAETRSNTGGDIKVNLQELLLLRSGSKISTTAGNQQFGGDGGNIAINSPFVVAVPRENSDITANAFTGKGGRVDITANGIFGILPQERLSQLSDITASSELGVSGQVTIITPDVDPSRGLAELPTNVVDASQQIASGCSPRGRQTVSSLIVTGRGGLPLSPHEPLRGRAVITNWVNLPAATSATKSTPQLVEAQGWIVDADNNVILVGKSPQLPSAATCGS